MPDRRPPRRVLHAISQYGAVSEGFVVDAVGAVEPFGWESWVLCRTVLPEGTRGVPADDRIRTWTIPRGVLAGRWLRHNAPGAQTRVAERGAGAQVRSVAPAVIHAHFGWNLPDVTRISSCLRIPLLATFHASDVTVFPTLSRRQRLAPTGWGRANRYAGIFEHVAAGIAVSEFIADKVRALGFEAPVHVIPAGIRLEEFAYRRPVTTERPLRAIFVGRLVPRKGLDVLLRAMARPEAPQDALLHVIGTGPERDALQRLAAQLGVADRVTFAGAQRRTEVVSALQENDVLVMASRTMPTGEVEGSPVVTKEAQAIGLPVIATDNGGTRETLPPAHRAEVVPEEEPEALARALARVAGARSTWPSRCEAARGYVEGEFGWNALGARTAALYDELVRDGGPPVS